MATADRDKYLGRARAAEQEGMAQQVAPTMLGWFNAQALAVNHWAVRYAREQVLRVPARRWARWRCPTRSQRCWRGRARSRVAWVG
jgi:hypothetical protein